MVRPPSRGLPAALQTTAQPRVMLGQAGVEWAKIVALWSVLATLLLASDASIAAGWRLAGAAVAIVLLAGRLHALGVVLHDACHMRRADDSGNAARLRLLAVLAGYPITSTIEAMRFHHLRHHRSSCLANDPYFKRGVDGPGRSAWRRIAYRGLGVLITPFWTLRACIGTLIIVLDASPLRGTRAGAARTRLLEAYRRVFLQDRDAQSAASQREALDCARADPPQVAFFVATLALTWRWPIALALGYWIPLAIAGVLNAHRVLAEHVHVLRCDDALESMLETTVSHRGWWWRLVLYPRHIGLHEAHHLYPRVPLAQLPALDRWWRQSRRGAAVAARGEGG